ncbi:hypothetical protein B0H13DRAFT_1896250, partial [Mycena leptocephala]
TAPSAPDALEAWLTSAALPYGNDPIGYHSRQHEAAKTAQSLKGEAFSQMCLDYLLAPATSVDAERLFSFSGGTVSKLRNQLSEDSAHAAVMVGIKHAVGAACVLLSRSVRAGAARPNSGYPSVRVRDRVESANEALECRPERLRLGPPERSEGGEGPRMVGPLRTHEENRPQEGPRRPISPNTCRASAPRTVQSRQEQWRPGCNHWPVWAVQGVAVSAKSRKKGFEMSTPDGTSCIGARTG